MRKVILIGLVLILAGTLAAQQPMNNDSIIKLIQAGLSEDLIVSTINASPAGYDTSVDGLIELKSAGVSEKVMAAIMAKTIGGTPAASATTAVATAPAQAQDGRPRIAILDITPAEGARTIGSFETVVDDSSYRDGYYYWRGRRYASVERYNEARASDVLRDLFTTEFLTQGAGRIRVMERSQLDAIRGEQDLGQSGEVDTATAVSMGKLAGVRYMVTGRITRFAQRGNNMSTGWGVGRIVGRATGSGLAGAVAGSVRVGNARFEGRLDMRIIDVETGEIVSVAFDEGTSGNVSFNIAGGGNNILYDDTIVSQVFEPIVRTITPKLISGLLSSAY